MGCPASALSHEEIAARLDALPLWQYKDNALERVYTGTSYLESLEVLNRVARLSEEADHHPDLTLQWRRLTIRYWTHVAHGVTGLDFELARRVEGLLSAGAAPATEPAGAADVKKA